MLKHYKKITIPTILVACLMVTLIPHAHSQDERALAAGDRRARGIEAKADRQFARQDFDKAMEIYETAFKNNTLSPGYAAQFHLKTARLYLTLLEYSAAIPHYDAAMALNDELFTTADVCSYLDALRLSKMKMKAIGIARKYAFRDVYNSDRRFQNILHALNYEDGIMPIGAPEFNIFSMDKNNTVNAEFWVGQIEGDYFFANSNSRFHDPHKKFYHRTQYLPLGDRRNDATQKGEGLLLDKIPYAMQNGPLSLSKNLSTLIVTGIYYGKGENISLSGEGINAFRTKLLTSNYNARRRGWSSFTELFKGRDGYSYAHPFIFNNDKSLLFASDMPGGYGGYDIYVIHWYDEKNEWGLPINLGPYINTAGDEITPCIFQNSLIFASNGQIGFGGYDLYGVEYVNGAITIGSLEHFGYPINTVNNEFNMLRINENSGYFVSDRNTNKKDDIFYFERNLNFASKERPFGMSDNQLILNGMHDFPTTSNTSGAARVEELTRQYHPDHVVSLYFDFDSSELNAKAVQDLKNWLESLEINRIGSLLIEGYADEFGRDDYNLVLSAKRANTVGDYLAENGINAPAETVGKGVIVLLNDLNDEKKAIDSPWSITMEKPVWLTKEARRVDIKATIK